MSSSEVFLALASALPPPGSVFPIEDRVRWLRAFAAVAAYIYAHDDNIKITALEGEKPVEPVHAPKSEGISPSLKPKVAAKPKPPRKTYDRVCAHCGKPFTCLHHKQKFCDWRCARASREAVNCAECEKPIDRSVRRMSKYCSDECHNLGEARRRGRRPSAAQHTGHASPAFKAIVEVARRSELPEHWTADQACEYLREEMQAVVVHDGDTFSINGVLHDTLAVVRLVNDIRRSKDLPVITMTMPLPPLSAPVAAPERAGDPEIEAAVAAGKITRVPRPDEAAEDGSLEWDPTKKKFVRVTRPRADLDRMLMFLRSEGDTIVGAGADGHYTVNGTQMKLNEVLARANRIRVRRKMEPFQLQA